MYIEGEDEKQARELTAKIKKLGAELKETEEKFKSGELKLTSKQKLMYSYLGDLSDSDRELCLNRVENEELKALWEARNKSQEIKTLKEKVVSSGIKTKKVVVEETRNEESGTTTEAEQDFDTFLSNLF